ncbi:MAG: hypothetical protein OXQ94_10860 [Gemmatimonadota bacterium]|nr:hypothetical protein [Gemmatimonadota bacterium]MDE2872168.1 hypothetical protein [Gemmatimonadota bacterium]
MRARAVAGPVVVVALAASSACEIVRPVDPLEAHPDVVALALLLVAGESEARLLAVHPHRDVADSTPEITAFLDGPGWTASFSESVRLPTCGELGGSWLVPSKCLRAKLPEAIEPGGEYGLWGTAPLGSFTGETGVPELPLLVDPANTLRLSMPDTAGLIQIPMRYAVGPETGTVLADLYDVFEISEDGSEEEIPTSHIGAYPVALENAQADTIRIYQDGVRMRLSLRLLGIGWNYTNFAKYPGIDPLPRPWPSFGIEGEGVYGYFDGIAHSETRRVFVGQTGRHDRN